MSTCCLIVPCYNEAERLDGEAFSRFGRAHPGVNFLFVNDGSRDETSEVIQGLAAKDPVHIRALDLAANSGKAEAIRTGTLAAFQWEAFDYVGFLDADLSAPLESVVQLRQALDEEPRYALAMGSRVALLGRTIRRNPRRHYLGRVFATAVSVMLKLPVYDTQCGAKLMRRSLASEVFREAFITRWFFDVEILFRILDAGAVTNGANIVEVPLLVWTEKGDSRLRAFDVAKTPIELFRIWWHYRAKSSTGSTR